MLQENTNLQNNIDILNYTDGIIELLKFINDEYVLKTEAEKNSFEKDDFILLGRDNVSSSYAKYRLDLDSTPSVNCIINELSKIKYYDKDNSIIDKPKLIYDITYENFYPQINKLLFILDVEREILLELHNYELKHKSIGTNIFGHRFKIRCKYIWNDNDNDVIVKQSDSGYYEVELEFANVKDNFVKIYDSILNPETTQEPDSNYENINSVNKILNIINKNEISLLNARDADTDNVFNASLKTIVEDINLGSTRVTAIYQYKRVDYLKLILNDIIKRNIYYHIYTYTRETGPAQGCQWEDNSILLDNFKKFHNNFANYIYNHQNEFGTLYAKFINIINNKKATGKVWIKDDTVSDRNDLNNYENITDIDRYNKLVGYIRNNYDNFKALNSDSIPKSISLSLAQIESLSKNDFYNGNKTAYIEVEAGSYYYITYDDILFMNNLDDEIYKTEKIFEKTTKLRDINDELEKKNKLLKTINSNVEFEKKKLDKINIVYIFTICLFILLSIILILLGSDKIDYKRGRNFINTLIFLTFIIFFGLHYYIGKIKETQKDSIKLNNILDDEIFKVKSTIEKFALEDKEFIKERINHKELGDGNLDVIFLINFLNGYDALGEKQEIFSKLIDEGDNFNDISFINILNNKSNLLMDQTKSYYNVVDPLLNKELEDYDKRNENTKMYKNIADFNLNISRRDTKFSIETINYLLNLSLLLAIILLVMFYNSDFTAIIGVIGIIIFIIISILYFTRILRIVRTDNKKKYWQKPLESDLKKL